MGANAVVCAAQDQCRVAGVCDPATGACSNPTAADGTLCNDGNLCTQTDTCVAGSCAGANPVACAAPDACHIGVCSPATGQCAAVNAPDGATCDDANACTPRDTCVAGTCVGADPVVCTASSPCLGPGACDPATGQCAGAPLPDGTACDDGNACTNADRCMGGACVGTDAVVCTPSEACHEAGACDPATGVCSSPTRADGTACDDGDRCTRVDSCQDGVCVGRDRLVCAAPGACEQAGTCDPTTGQCTHQAKANGAACDDGDLCTQSDTCQAGICRGGDAVLCAAIDECHTAGVCEPATGRCSNPVAADGTPCEDGDACSEDDFCVDGECIGEPMPDGDGDGVCDPVDLCPAIPDPYQMDLDGDGIGDMCQCTAPAPGRCIAGGGSKTTDCLLEFTTGGPVTLNARGTQVKGLLRCSDGDPSCDLDGTRDGQCTFGVALCFGNADPRFPRCAPAAVFSMEVMQPSATGGPAMSRANAQHIEGALMTLGIEVRRRGRVVAGPSTPMGGNICSPPVRLVTAAPTKGKAVKQKFQLRAQGMNRKRDMDRFVLMCEPPPPNPTRP
jgi:hypothetical protein